MRPSKTQIVTKEHKSRKLIKLIYHQKDLKQFSTCNRRKISQKTPTQFLRFYQCRTLAKKKFRFELQNEKEKV